MKIQILLFLSVSCIFFISCTNPFKGLTSDEKKLVTEIIDQMKNDTPKIKKSNFTGEVNSYAYYYYANLFSIKKYFEPIDGAKAKELQDNYTVKRGTIERLFPTSMRPGPGGSAVDTKAIWVPTDSLLKFMGALIQYEAKSNQKTGVEIVLGSYNYDRQRDNIMQGSNRQNQDSLSGRTTIFFVATHDTVANTTDTYVSRHKSIIAPGSKFSAGLDIYNHGALCPDSCAITGY